MNTVIGQPKNCVQIYNYASRNGETIHYIPINKIEENDNTIKAYILWKDIVAISTHVQIWEVYIGDKLYDNLNNMTVKRNETFVIITINKK